MAQDIFNSMSLEERVQQLEATNRQLVKKLDNVTAELNELRQEMRSYRSLFKGSSQDLIDPDQSGSSIAALQNFASAGGGSVGGHLPFSAEVETPRSNMAFRTDSFISAVDLAEYVRKGSKDVIAIDLRDPNSDYKGGNIPHSVNLPYDTLYKSREQSLKAIHQYSHHKIIVFVGLYGHLRSQSIFGRYVELRRDLITDSNTKAELVSELKDQEVKILEFGAHGWINRWRQMEESQRQQLITDYDPTVWRVTIDNATGSEMVRHAVEWNGRKEASTKHVEMFHRQ